MPTVFSFGASTAAGAKDVSGGGFITRLGRFLQDSDRGSSLNHGIGGDTTEDMAARLEKVISALPTYDSFVPVVTLGINDVPRIEDEQPEKRVSLERHRELVTEMLARLSQLGPVVYLTQYPVDYVDRSLDAETVIGYIDTGREVALQQGAHLVDIFRMIDQERFDRFIDQDGLHFNARGHEFIANVLLSELLKLELV